MTMIVCQLSEGNTRILLQFLPVFDNVNRSSRRFLKIKFDVFGVIDNHQLPECFSFGDHTTVTSPEVLEPLILILTPSVAPSPTLEGPEIKPRASDGSS